MPLSRGFVRASRARPLVYAWQGCGSALLGERVRGSAGALSGVGKAGPAAMFTLTARPQLVPRPLSEPDRRLSRIRLPATIFRYNLMWASRRSPVLRLCVRPMPLRPTMLASPPSLHPNYQASSVLRSDPTSRAPFAFLASSARTGILPRGRTLWISLVAVVTRCQARTGLRPRVLPRHSPPRGAGYCLR
jgi:hypothetical protein